MSAPRQETATKPHEASDRVGAVLHALVRNGMAGAGARELAAELGASKSAMHRILQALEEVGVAASREDGRYQPGHLLLVWARFLEVSHPFLTLGRARIAELVEQTQETALLLGYRFDDHDAVVVASAEFPQPVRYAVPVGSTVPLDRGSAGRAILAALDEDQRDQLRSNGMAVPDDVDSDAPFCLSRGERIPEAAGAAGAVRAAGSVLGAINITVPQYRVSDERLSELGQLVGEATAKLSDELDAALRLPSAQDHPDSGTGVARSEEGPAVSRVVRLLDFIIRGPAAGREIRECAAPTEVGVATCERMLTTLAAHGLVQGPVEDRWMCGPDALVLPAALDQRAMVEQRRLELLQRLVEAVGETACVFVYDPDQHDGCFEAVFECPAPVRYTVPFRSRAPLHAGAAGKAVLAHSEDGLDSIRSLERFTETTITDPAALRAELDQIRTRGYATSFGERIAEAVGVAAPYFRRGEVAGSITVSMPKHRHELARTAGIAEHVIAAAAALTELETSGLGPLPN